MQTLLVLPGYSPSGQDTLLDGGPSLAPSRVASLSHLV